MISLIHALAPGSFFLFITLSLETFLKYVVILTDKSAYIHIYINLCVCVYVYQKLKWDLCVVIGEEQAVSLETSKCQNTEVFCMGC